MEDVENAEKTGFAVRFKEDCPHISSKSVLMLPVDIPKSICIFPELFVIYIYFVKISN